MINNSTTLILIRFDRKHLYGRLLLNTPSLVISTIDDVFSYELCYVCIGGTIAVNLLKSFFTGYQIRNYLHALKVLTFHICISIQCRKSVTLEKNGKH